MCYCNVSAVTFSSPYISLPISNSATLLLNKCFIRKYTPVISILNYQFIIQKLNHEIWHVIETHCVTYWVLSPIHYQGVGPITYKLKMTMIYFVHIYNLNCDSLDTFNERQPFYWQQYPFAWFLFFEGHIMFSFHVRFFLTCVKRNGHEMSAGM